MRTDFQVIKVSDELAMPWDLTEWFDPVVLRQWITEEIESLDWNNPELIDYLRSNPAFQPKMLLCLLAYAYATGLFDSEEIVRRCEKDETLRSICGSHVPASGHALIRFRRENRGLLKWSLVQLFKRAIRARLGEFHLPAGLKRRLLDVAVTRLDMARQMDRGGEGL
ncbi:MAG TPA: transposase [Verrucomicrobiae bacterium]|jgi:hypothetical protein